MEREELVRTPFLRLIVGAIIGLGTSIAPLVLLGFGLATFNIIRVVGPQNATAVYGMAGGISGVAIVIMGPLGGIIADKTTLKFGRRRFWMVAGSIGGAISMLTFAYAPNVELLILAYVLVAFFYGMVSLSCYAIVPEQVEPEKFGRVSGLFGAAAPVCTMIGSVLVGIFAAVPVQEKLVVLTVVQLVGGIAAALILKDNQFKGNTDAKKSEGIFHNFYPSIRKHPEFTWALLTRLFINVTNAGLNVLALFYIARFHLGEVQISQIMGLQAPAIIIMVVAGIFGGFISDKIKKQKIFVMLAALVTGICMLVFAFAPSVTVVIIGNFAFNFGFGMYTAVDNALVNRILPSKEDAGKHLSLMNATTNLSSAVVTGLTPILIGLGAKMMGGDGFTFLFLVLTASAVISAIAVMPIPEVSQDKESATQG